MQRTACSFRAAAFKNQAASARTAIDEQDLFEIYHLRTGKSSGLYQRYKNEIQWTVNLSSCL